MTHSGEIASCSVGRHISHSWDYRTTRRAPHREADREPPKQPESTPWLVVVLVMLEDPEIKRKRLRYRSWHRGTKELDLLLGQFAERHLDQFSDAEIDLYEIILEADEHDIYGWVSGRQAVPPLLDNHVMAAILNFKLTAGS